MTGVMPRLQLVAAALLMCVPALVPLHTAPIPSFYAEWVAVLLGLVAATVLCTTRRPVGEPWLFWGLLGLCAVLVLQVQLGRVGFPGRSLLAAAYVLWLALLVLTGRALATRWGSERLAVVLQIALAAGGFLQAVAGLMQVGEIEVLGLVVTPAQLVGIVAQRNHLANLVSLGLWSVVWLAATRRIAPETAGLAMLPMLLALVACGSRMVWIYALAGLVVTHAGWAARPGRDRLALGAVGALVLLLFAQDFFGGLSGERLADAVATAGNAGDAMRLTLWRYAWVLFTQYPWLGVGYGEFAFHTLALAPAVGLPLGAVIDFQAHNTALQLAAETGLIGLACVALPLAAWAWRLPWAGRPGHAWLGLAVLVQLAHSAVEFPLWYAYLAGPAALWIGASSRPVQRGGSRRLQRIASGAALLAGAWVLVGTLADYRVLEGVARSERLRPEDLPRLAALADTPFASRVAPAFARLLAPVDAAGAAPAAALAVQALRAHPVPETLDHAIALLEQSGQARAAAWWREARTAAFGPPR